MTTRNILVRNTFWLGLVEVFSKLIMFGVTVSLVRYLGPQGFGTFNLAFSYVAMFLVLSDFGLNTIATRDVSKHRQQTAIYLNNLIGIKVSLSVLIAILVSVSLFILPTSGTKIMILLAMLYGLLQNIGSIFISIFVAWERMELVFVTRLLYYVGILVSVLMAVLFHSSSTNIIIAYGIITALSVLFSTFIVGRLGIPVKISFDFDFWRQLLKETIPFAGLAIVGTIYANNDTLLVGNFLGSTQAGFYQSAYKILFAFQSINVINNAIFPRINILIHESKTQSLVKLVKIILVLSILGLVPLATIITIFHDQIITLIYGITYVPAGLSMAILIWAGVANYFRNFTSNLLFARKKQNQVFFAVSLGLVVNLIINLIYLPRFGLVAAAWSLLISEITMFLGNTYWLQKILIKNRP